MPLSRPTTVRRIDSLSADVENTLLADLRLVDHFSLAVDESTDSTDIAQLSLYVRFFDGTCFREELLCLMPLTGGTTAEDLMTAISGHFDR